jgi:hypothetical protein
MQVTEAIKAFLLARKSANADLIDRIVRYWPDLECQVNVVPGETDKPGVYGDGVRQWFNIRIPKKANSEPEFNDFQIPFPLEEYAEAIGFTGWDWRNRRSRWVGYDFDGITHAEGLSDEALTAVKTAVEALPYVEIRKSKSGKGLHLYVYLDVPTENHNEHAALSHAVLGVMSRACNFDFAEYVDCCGMVLWAWHRDAASDGMSVVKAAESEFSSLDLPDNWKDAVVKKSRQTPLDDLISKTRAEPLDSEHRAIIEALQKSGYTTTWDSERHLLQTHTKALQELSESDAGIRGVFKTVSQGTHPATPNCFMFPEAGGSFRVFRFHKAPEAETWEISKDGWTNCYFNRAPALDEAVKYFGGMNSKKNQYFFEDIKQIAQAIALIGEQFEVPDVFEGRCADLIISKDSIKVSVKKERGDKRPQGWAVVDRTFVKTLSKPDTPKNNEPEQQFDEEVRATCAQGLIDRWAIHVDGKGWLFGSESAAVNRLSMTCDPKEIKSILGQLTNRAWELVTRPFEDEYPGHRQWNRGAPQYSCDPVEGPHPHWDMVLSHCFSSLDSIIADDAVCQKLGIASGYHYGLYWVASILQDPYQPLPYLFFYGVENCGKSTFHDAFKLLVTKGCVAGEAAIRARDNFNGELEGAVLVYIEEINVAQTPGVMTKLKAWISDQDVLVRSMKQDQRQQRNTRHFVQMANHLEFCPAEPGDTRVMVIYVPQLGESEIQDLKAKLEEEKAHFLYTALNVELPPKYKRLRLPVISTAAKEQLQATRETLLEQFLKEKCETDSEGRILLKDFYNKYVEWLGEEADDYLPEKIGKNKLSKELPKEITQTILHGYKALRGIKWKE